MGDEKTSKLSGWQPQAQPDDQDELNAYRQMICESIFGLWQRKKEILETKSMPAQPVSLAEIYAEVTSRVTMRRSIKDWKWKLRSKRWVDRRVNECACPKFYETQIPKIVAATAGLYMPNPHLFAKA